MNLLMNSEEKMKITYQFSILFKFIWNWFELNKTFLKVEYSKSILWKFQTNQIIIYGDKWLWMEPFEERVFSILITDPRTIKNN